MILSKRNDKLSCFVTKTVLKHVRVDLKNCIVNNSNKKSPGKYVTINDLADIYPPKRYLTNIFKIPLPADNLIKYKKKHTPGNNIL